MSDRAAFLRAIIAAPADDLPRLVMADWLDEASDPLGEFIRLQCELAKGCTRCDGDGKAHGSDRPFEGPPGDCPKCGALRRREQELFRDAKGFMPPEWAPILEVAPTTVSTGPVGAGGPTVTRTYRRGFVECLTLDAETFLRHADALTAATPLRRVRLTTPVRLADLGGTIHPAGARLLVAGQWVEVRAEGVTDQLAAALMARWPLLEFELPAVAEFADYDLSFSGNYFEYDDRMPGPDPVHRGPGPRPGRLGL